MKCIVCKKLLSGRQKKYCSKSCQTNYWKNKRGVIGFNNLSSGTVGAMAELVAASDLMKRGFEVYRALSPSSNNDLVAIKNGKAYTFEVRTAYLCDNGKVSYSPQRIRSERVAAVIFATNEVKYFPEI